MKTVTVLCGEEPVTLDLSTALHFGLRDRERIDNERLLQILRFERCGLDARILLLRVHENVRETCRASSPEKYKIFLAAKLVVLNARRTP